MSSAADIGSSCWRNSSRTFGKAARTLSRWNKLSRNIGPDFRVAGANEGDRQSVNMPLDVSVGSNREELSVSNVFRGTPESEHSSTPRPFAFVRTRDFGARPDPNHRIFG